MPEGKIYIKPALAVIRNKKMLMVKDDAHSEKWFMLGGKQEPGETELEGLKREVQEEVSCKIKKDSLSFLKEFEDTAYGKPGARVRIRLYIGELEGEPRPSNEVVDCAFFDSSIDHSLLTPISIQIFDWLKQSRYVD